MDFLARTSYVFPMRDFGRVAQRILKDKLGAVGSMLGGAVDEFFSKNVLKAYPDKAHVDYKIAVADGGANDPSGIVAALRNGAVRIWAFNSPGAGAHWPPKIVSEKPAWLSSDREFVHAVNCVSDVQNRLAGSSTEEGWGIDFLNLFGASEWRKDRQVFETVALRRIFQDMEAKNIKKNGAVGT